MNTKTLVLCLALAVAWVPEVGAQPLIELELGLKVPVGDAAEILGPGVGVGGTLGYSVARQFALVGHLDFGIHPAADKTFSAYDQSSGTAFTYNNRDVVDGGASLDITLGGRFMPLGGDATARFQPYVGASAGLASIAWGYTSLFRSASGYDADALGALVIAGEAGGGIKMSENISIVAGGRVKFHRWRNETVNGFGSGDLWTPGTLDGKFTGPGVDLFGRLSIAIL